MVFFMMIASKKRDAVELHRTGKTIPRPKRLEVLEIAKFSGTTDRADLSQPSAWDQQFQRHLAPMRIVMRLIAIPRRLRGFFLPEARFRLLLHEHIRWVVNGLQPARLVDRLQIEFLVTEILDRAMRRRMVALGSFVFRSLVLCLNLGVSLGLRSPLGFKFGIDRMQPWLGLGRFGLIANRFPRGLKRLFRKGFLPFRRFLDAIDPRRALRRDRERALIKPDRKKPLLLLIRKIDQFTEIGDELLRRRVLALGALHGQLVLAVPEAHHLHEPAGRFPAGPVRANLLEHIELVASQTVKRLPEPPHQARMLGPFFLGNHVAIALQQHETLLFGDRENRESMALCHNHSAPTNLGGFTV
jgi:hypothetical protein